jgi:hypothetical protein
MNDKRAFRDWVDGGQRFSLRGFEMSFKKIWDFLSSVLVDKYMDELVDVRFGKRTEEAVLKIAVAVAEKEAAEKEGPWAELVPRDVTFQRDGRTKRLIWSVRFLLNWVDGDYMHGPMGFITIDDETGEVISKDYSSHP